MRRKSEIQRRDYSNGIYIRNFEQDIQFEFGYHGIVMMNAISIETQTEKFAHCDAAVQATGELQICEFNPLKFNVKRVVPSSGKEWKRVVAHTHRAW